VAHRTVQPVLGGLGNSILAIFGMKAENPAHPWQNWIVMELLVFLVLIVLGGYGAVQFFGRQSRASFSISSKPSTRFSRPRRAKSAFMTKPSTLTTSAPFSFSFCS
jgi:hypothetical protein